MSSRKDFAEAVLCDPPRPSSVIYSQNRYIHFSKAARVIQNVFPPKWRHAHSRMTSRLGLELSRISAFQCFPLRYVLTNSCFIYMTVGRDAWTGC